MTERTQITRVPQQVLDEVNAFLDMQTAYVKETLERLDHLRAAVIRRDEGALEKMSDEVRHESFRKAQYDRAMQALRQSLARILGCRAEEVCLSRLCQQVEPAVQKDLSERQKTLQLIIRRLNNEVHATEALLQECARFNRLLLNSLLGNQPQAVTYDARGISRWSPQGNLMNMRF